MSHKTLLCAGFGYTAKAFARRLTGNGWCVIGTTRDPDKQKSIVDEGVEPLVLSGGQEPDLVGALSKADALLVSAPPGEAACPALAMITPHITHMKTLRWVGYLSSNGVYGDHNGQWVDEDTPPQPTSERGKRRLLAEKAWLEFSKVYNANVIVFRLPGIYGPGRSAIDTVRAGTAKRIVKPGQVFNRMHVDDIALALEKALAKHQQGDTTHQIFNLCDDEPSPPQDVVTYACELLGVEPPPVTPLEETDLSPMGRSFYRDNKRVRNTRMKQSLGAKLQYPDYRVGLDAILSDNTSKR